MTFYINVTLNYARVLAVHFIGFTASTQGSHTGLMWKVPEEQSVDRHEVKRSVVTYYLDPFLKILSSSSLLFLWSSNSLLRLFSSVSHREGAW
jgi:hypothetical protein